MFTLEELEAASRHVHEMVPPTPQYRWPLLCEELGCDVWVKHENHTPIGAFKIRGGLVYLNELLAEHPDTPGVITATRGNHGQSIALAASRHGVSATVYAPHGNSLEKNAAMRSFGANLVEYGADFDEARIEAGRVAEEKGLTFVPSFHPWLVKGVATYAHELLAAVSGLDTVYVPVGMGSGICGLIKTRDLLGLETEIVGVVSDNAPAYALSFEADQPVETNSADTFADGLAVRIPHPEALDIIKEGAARIIRVTEQEVSDAVRLLYRATHNVAEGAGAAALAALMQESGSMKDRKAAVILTGGNIDAGLFNAILEGKTPSPGARA